MKRWLLGVVLAVGMMAWVGVALAQQATSAPAPASAPVATPPAPLAPAAARAAGQANGSKVAKPTVAVAADGCVTAECHANVKAAKVLHGPVNVNACDACHKLVSAKEHIFEDKRSKTETCTFCHKTDVTMPVMHKPVTDGQCLECHDPHGGKTGKFLRGNTMNDLCSKCHQDVMAGKEHVHGPVAAGACGSCHLPHGGQNEKLLVARGRDLCFTCHQEMQQQLKTVKFQHKAVQQECTSCHDPHASKYTMQIKREPVKLCTECHQKIGDQATKAPHKHSVVTADKACLNCHTAHGGDLSKLMRAEPTKVCMKCHTQDVVAAADNGRKVHSVKEAIDPNLCKHGSIRDGQCAGCHNVHGSDQSRLLAKAYPEQFYSPFSMEKYELCFTCHDKQLVELPDAPGLTNFRNGTQNLHYLHVNKTDKGRTCRACHATHASTNDRLIRESVPFGNWQLPINYKKTSDGGSCSPGCHQPYSYDRVNPVKSGTGTTTRPAPQPSVAERPTAAADAGARKETTP